MAKVLIADDENAICLAFKQFLEIQGHEALIAANGLQAVEICLKSSPDLVFLDVQMPGISGLETLALLREAHPSLPVIIMTAYGTVSTAIEALQLGAFDYVGKPLDLPQINQLIEHALNSQLISEASDMSSEKATLEPIQLVGQGKEMQAVFRQIGLLTTNDMSVLINGETGTGKELVAHNIHQFSERRDQPFIAINCAAIPENLLESELFGHEKGAFTGAEQRKIGKFEAAEAGTIFLDEIAELPLSLQTKLLRVLQERCFEPIGSHRSVPLQARVISATNLDLELLTAEGRFRQDLYFRLKMAHLEIPPLRCRQEDIGILCKYLLKRACIELGRPLVTLPEEALHCLRNQPWPGNVRELEHLLKRALLETRGQQIPATTIQLLCEDNPKIETAGTPVIEEELRSTMRQLLEQQMASAAANSTFHQIIQKIEQILIEEALTKTSGNQLAASKMLGLHRTTLRKKIGL